MTTAQMTPADQIEITRDENSGLIRFANAQRSGIYLRAFRPELVDLARLHFQRDEVQRQAEQVAQTLNWTDDACDFRQLDDLNLAIHQISLRIKREAKRLGLQPQIDWMAH